MRPKIETLDQRSKMFSLASLILLFLPYFLVNAGFLFSEKSPTNDSASYHYPAFEAIAESYKRDHRFPQIFWVSGGTPLSFTHLSFFHFIPHRLLGYSLYVLLPASVLFVYKLQLLLGMSLTALGWWLVLKRWFGSAVGACLGAQMILMGGTGITFHQEQVWSTVHLIPWLILAIQNLKSDPVQVVACAAIAGLGLSTHQPQIQLLTMAVILIAAFLYRPVWAVRSWSFSRRQIVAGLLLFFLGTLPSLYLFLQMDQLSSPIRGTERLSAQTFEEYTALNHQQISSALPVYFEQYVTPVFSTPGIPADRCSFFVGRVGILLAAVGLLAGGARVLPVLLCLIVFSLLSLGFNSPIPIPKILFMARFPFIGSFRQWFHFFPMVNFSLSILACFGIATLHRFVSRPKLAYLVLGLLLALQVVDLSFYCRRYLKDFTQISPTRKLEESVFARENEGPAALFVYKSRNRAQKTLPAGIEAANADQSRYLHVIETSVADQGLNLHVKAEANSLLTVPLNYDLRWNATVDGSKTEVLRVKEALTGVFLEKGFHRIRFTPVADFYGPIVLIQILLYAWVFSRILSATWKNLFQFSTPAGP